jgi:hypothetical protein
MKQFERVDSAPGYDKHGKIVHMVTSGGYVMVKRPRCMPFVLSLKEWAQIPKQTADTQAKVTP